MIKHLGKMVVIDAWAEEGWQGSYTEKKAVLTEPLMMAEKNDLCPVPVHMIITERAEDEG